MRQISLISLGFAGAVALWGGAAAAAPSQLYGKSVVVTWTEERNQRANGEATVQNVMRNAQFSVYVSSSGKPFSRMSYTFSGARGGLKSGSRDAVGGESSARNISFQGNTINVLGGKSMKGGARSIRIAVDGGGCSAQVITGKEEGASAIRATSIVTGSNLEILSVKTGAASCRIQDGNVFGSE